MLVGKCWLTMVFNCFWLNNCILLLLRHLHERLSIFFMYMWISVMFNVWHQMAPCTLLVTVGLFRWVCLLNLLMCLVLPSPLAPSILSLPPTRTRVCIPNPLWLVCSWWEAEVAGNNASCGRKDGCCGVRSSVALEEWLWDGSDQCLASWRCLGPN